MRVVSPLLKHVVYPGLAKTGYLRRAAGSGPAVVTYHGVLPAGYEVVDSSLDGSLVTAESFRQQLLLLKNKYSVISPQQFLQWCEGKCELPPLAVMLTCDDGLRNTLTDMLPILQEAGLSCLFFVTSASLDDVPTMLWYEELYRMLLAVPEAIRLELPEIEANVQAAGRSQKRQLWWDLVKRFSPHDARTRRAFLDQIRIQFGFPETWSTECGGNSAQGRRFSLLTLGELRQLAAAGMFVGAHTFSHPMLSQSPDELVWREISENRSGLERSLRERIWALAYPFGDYGSVGRRELKMAERAGFQCAFLNVGGGLGAETPRFAIPRVHVTSEMSLAEFEAHVSGFYRSLRRLMREDDGVGIAGRAQGAGKG